MLWCCSKRVTTSDMGITNGIDIFTGTSGATAIMTANNDNFVRVFDAEVSRCCSCALLLPFFCAPPGGVHPSAGQGR